MKLNYQDSGWFISFLLIITFLITPILYAMWQKEKNIANEYRKAYFDLWKISENILSGETSIEELENYFKEKERIEKLRNEWLYQRIKYLKVY